VTPQGAVGSNPTLSATLESPLGYDMYPLYWITSKGGILMRYSYEFKRKAIELFYLNTKLWDKMVLIWVHIKVIKMKKLFLNLEVIDGYPPVSMESIWVEVTEEGYLKVNNIPFYSKEISLGDIVSVIQKEENYLLYDKTIIHSKNSTLRIVFFNENQKFKDKILTKLIDLGCEYEAFNINFYAINIPIQVDIEEIYNFLDEFVETDDLDYDTGYLAQ